MIRPIKIVMNVVCDQKTIIQNNVWWIDMNFKKRRILNDQSTRPIKYIKIKDKERVKAIK